MVMQLHWGVSVEKDAKPYTLGGDRDLAKSEQLHRFLDFLDFLDWMRGGLGLPFCCRNHLRTLESGHRGSFKPSCSVAMGQHQHGHGILEVIGHLL